MKFALLIYNNRTELESRSEGDEQANHDAYQAIADTPGLIGGAELEPIAIAKTVRVREGQPMIVDGPVVDSVDALGGYLLFEADDLEAALAFAARIPDAKSGAIEVRTLVFRD